MSQSLKASLKYPALFCVGGLAYYAIEILYRGYSHWTMILLGGICFLLCGELNEIISWEMPIVLQQAICSLAITMLEFIFGVVLNIVLKLGLWDYSAMPFNLLGQICLPFTIVWFFLSIIAIVLDDYLRYLLWDEEKPRYTIF